MPSPAAACSGAPRAEFGKRIRDCLRGNRTLPENSGLTDSQVKDRGLHATRAPPPVNHEVNRLPKLAFDFGSRHCCWLATHIGTGPHYGGPKATGQRPGYGMSRYTDRNCVSTGSDVSRE